MFTVDQSMAAGSDFYDLTFFVDSSKADLTDYLCLTPLIDSPIVRLTAAIEGFGNLRRTRKTYGRHDDLPSIPVLH